ncbi:hypothetical protein BH23VER1_BH23VER1_20660 [soil metagenome]
MVPGDGEAGFGAPGTAVEADLVAGVEEPADDTDALQMDLVEGFFGCLPHWQIGPPPGRRPDGLQALGGQLRSGGFLLVDALPSSIRREFIGGRGPCGTRIGGQRLRPRALTIRAKIRWTPRPRWVSSDNHIALSPLTRLSANPPPIPRPHRNKAHVTHSTVMGGWLARRQQRRGFLRVNGTVSSSDQASLPANARVSRPSPFMACSGYYISCFCHSFPGLTGIERVWVIHKLTDSRGDEERQPDCLKEYFYRRSFARRILGWVYGSGRCRTCTNSCAPMNPIRLAAVGQSMPTPRRPD